jgi:hypothetical protein
MLATCPKPRTSRRTSAMKVRRLLLEITYQMHATAVIVRPRPARRRGPFFRPTAPR